MLNAYKTLTLRRYHGHFNAGLELGRLCYVLCRFQKPGKVIETSVANGATSAFILQALGKNGGGELYSIDLPPLAVYGGVKLAFWFPII